jgi:hypothetical protein
MYQLFDDEARNNPDYRSEAYEPSISGVCVLFLAIAAGRGGWLLKGRMTEHGVQSEGVVNSAGGRRFESKLLSAKGIAGSSPSAYLTLQVVTSRFSRFTILTIPEIWHNA